MSDLNVGKPRFDLADPQLFGAEAAEAEANKDVFNSYFYETGAYADFVDMSRPFQIANAYKGEGKSSFLRALEEKVRTEKLGYVARFSSADLEVADQGANSDAWMRAWRRSLAEAAAIELGKTIKVAWSEDDIRAVEEAERLGQRERNWIGLILDRFVLKLKGANAELSLKSSSEGLSTATVERLLEKKTFWLLVDESDVNFINSEAGRAKVAGLLTACRKMCQTTPSLRVRSTLRPTTWSALYANIEDMTHIRDSLVSLEWQTQDIRNILSKRIESYLIRTNQIGFSRRNNGPRLREEEIINLLFPGPWKWAKHTDFDDGFRPSFVTLSNLCRDRPRWLIELCKEAALRARKRESEVIDKDDVVRSLSDFGRRRLLDIEGEFKAESAQIGTIINGFRGQNESYKTDELLKLIKNRVTNLADVRISYENGRCSPIQVGHFLFKIGFLTARKDTDQGTYRHFSYAERPDLLRDPANLDQGCSWEVHPIYRQTLEMRDESGLQMVRERNATGKESR
ncbi:MAG TPA: hypothetical protein VG944_07880 [Fimbriimonas sp.]|nr:hypothetical protein [Fimbriimonas sp.]